MTQDAVLEPGVAVSAERLSRRSAATADFMPVTSVFQRLFRREWQGVAVGEDLDVDDDDVGDEDEEALDEARQDDVSERWALRDVSFTVPRGSALGVVGPPSGGRALLLRVIAGHVPPTAGRVLIGGRRGPTVEAASKLMRPDLHPDQNLKLLARLLGVPRGERDRFIDETLELAFGVRRGARAPDLKNAALRTASACVFDPTADVLLVDEFPAGDERFRERCLERLSEALARGASALVASDDVELLRETCHAAIRLEAGRVVARGPVAEVAADLDRAAAGPERRRAGAELRPFDSRAAILELATSARGGAAARESEVELAVLLETVEPDTTVAVRIRIRDEGGRVEAVESPSELLADAGRYRITVALPPRLLAQDGSYRLDVLATVEVDGARSRIGRSTSLLVGAGPEDDPDVTEETVGEAGGPLEPEPAPTYAEWTVEQL